MTKEEATKKRCRADKVAALIAGLKGIEHEDLRATERYVLIQLQRHLFICQGMVFAGLMEQIEARMKDLDSEIGILNEMDD